MEETGDEQRVAGGDGLVAWRKRGARRRGGNEGDDPMRHCMQAAAVADGGSLWYLPPSVEVRARWGRRPLCGMTMRDG